MNSYSSSDGTRYKKSVIDNKVKKAKRQFLEDFRDEHGYHYCEHCKRSDKKLSCSHIVSVDQCQKAGKCEVAWDTYNLLLLCLVCHANDELHSEKEKWKRYYVRKT